MSSEAPDSKPTAQQETQLLKPDRTIKCLDKKPKGEYARFLRLNRQTVKDYPRCHVAANIDTTSYKDIKNLATETLVSQLFIGSWRRWSWGSRTIT
jgi:hypothetical protein